MTRHHLMLIATLALGACSSTPMNTPATSVAAATPVATAAAPMAPAPVPESRAAAGPAPASSVTATALPAHLDPKSALSAERSVYFEFDDFTIPQAYAAAVERHGRYLAEHPKVVVRIEGNADERGSTEYNLALGQKRAEAVSRALRLLGAAEHQIDAVSWGEEKPTATAHDESAWARNRRADLQYARP